MNSLLSNRNFATLYIFIFITHIFLIDGMSSTMIYGKVVLMGLAPIIFINKVPYISKAFFWGMLLFLYQYFSALFTSEVFRSSTIIFSGLLILTFISVYNLIYLGAFSREYFIRFLKFIILSFTICLIAQQLTNIIGISQSIFINKVYQLTSRGVFAGNSLSLEPSHTARVLGVAFYAFLRVNEKIADRALSLKQLFVEHRLVTFCFLWSMITMGSGTAFVALGVLLLYFIKKQYVAIIVPVILIMYFVIPMIDYEPLNRVRTVIEITISGDSEELVKKDGSAASRIKPMLNTISTLDLSKSETWFGYGIDYGKKFSVYSDQLLSGGILEYGFIYYILSLILVFSCAIEFWSLGTIMFFIGIGGGTSNIAYNWGILMIFVCISYFHKEYNED